MMLSPIAAQFASQTVEVVVGHFEPLPERVFPAQLFDDERGVL
jgi:hypothetical protein